MRVPKMKQAIVMKCNKRQVNELLQALRDHGIINMDITEIVKKENLIVNNFQRVDNFIADLFLEGLNLSGRIYYENYDLNTFLDACGVDTSNLDKILVYPRLMEVSRDGKVWEERTVLRQEPILGGYLALNREGTEDKAKQLIEDMGSIVCVIFKHAREIDPNKKEEKINSLIDYLKYDDNYIDIEVVEDIEVLDLFTYLNWGLTLTKEGYNKVETLIEEFNEKNTGNKLPFEVSACHDVSGYDYWVDNQEEDNYLHICIEIVDPGNFNVDECGPVIDKEVNTLLDSIQDIMNDVHYQKL